jgi:pyroglutamyl-peptidase
MKVLVTGFEPFGGEKINPAYEIVKELKDEIGGAEIIKLEVPTAFGVSIEKVIQKIDEEDPDHILCLGQAGGRNQISVEKVAINLNDARIPDNLNQQPIDSPIDPAGDTAYFSSLPVKAMVEAIQARGIAAAVSYTAGTYVCNHLMYGVLNYLKKHNGRQKAGFIHIPFLPEQVREKHHIPSMSLETMVDAIETAIKTILSTAEDIHLIGGEIS